MDLGLHQVEWQKLRRVEPRGVSGDQDAAVGSLRHGWAGRNCSHRTCSSLSGSCWKTCVCVTLQQQQQNSAIEVVDEVLPERALAVEPSAKRPHIKRLPAVATEAAPAEQESAASTAELAAAAKQVQELRVEDPMDVQDDNGEEEECSLLLSD